MWILSWNRRMWNVFTLNLTARNRILTWPCTFTTPKSFVSSLLLLSSPEPDDFSDLPRWLSYSNQASWTIQRHSFSVQKCKLHRHNNIRAAGYSQRVNSCEPWSSGNHRKSLASLLFWTLHVCCGHAFLERLKLWTQSRRNGVCRVSYRPMNL